MEEELDEIMHFYELLAEFNEDFKKELRALYKEANELLSIIVTSINTTLKNMKAEGERDNNLKPIRNRQSEIEVYGRKNRNIIPG